MSSGRLGLLASAGKNWLCGSDSESDTLHCSFSTTANKNAINLLKCHFSFDRDKYKPLACWALMTLKYNAAIKAYVVAQRPSSTSEHTLYACVFSAQVKHNKRHTNA